MTVQRLIAVSVLALSCVSGCGSKSSGAGAAGSEAVVPPLKIVTTMLAAATQGQPYAAPLDSTGGSGTPHTWSIVGALPPGLVLAATGSSASITGTPALPGVFDITVVVRDPAGAAAIAELRLDVAPGAPLAVSTVTLPSAQPGQPYAAPIHAAGGSGQGYTWRLQSGALPPGVTLAPTGTPSADLSGTPTATGAFSFTITVTDSIGQSAGATFQILVASVPILQLQTVALPTGHLNHPYSATLTAGGGSGQGYTWAVTSGLLPPGLTLGAAGTPYTTITGTPTATGAFACTIMVRDSLGFIATGSFVLDISGNQPLAIQNAPTLPGAWINLAYAHFFRAGGGTPPYQWSLASGALPPGLSLNLSGTVEAVLAGTATQIGTYAFTVEVTDSAQNTVALACALSVTARTDAWTSFDGARYRQSGAYVYTGSQIIQWGGAEFDPPAIPWHPGWVITGFPTNEGDVFTPGGSSAATSLTNAPIPRYYPGAVWTGSRMLVFGGLNSPFTTPWLPPYPADFKAYDPVTDTWTTLSLVNGPSPRQGHTMVWTGTEAIVFGGFTNGYGPTGYDVFGDGRAYNPVTDTWRVLPQSPIYRRYNHHAIWTGNKMIIWGGNHCGAETRLYMHAFDGAAYDPVTNAWTYFPPPEAPLNPNSPLIGWADGRLMMWAGADTDNPAGYPDIGGALWNEDTNKWSLISTQGQPDLYHAIARAWSGSKLFLWGLGGTAQPAGGRIYDMAADEWYVMTDQNAPDTSRIRPFAIWNGQQLVIWGGTGSTSQGTYMFSDGGIYTP
jgi:hypothetical protein